MAQDSPLSLADQFAAAMDWWREAGVDHAYEDDVTVWPATADPEKSAESSASQPPKPKPAAPLPPKEYIGGPQENWPDTLSHFSDWWLKEPSLDVGGASPRIPPRGPAGARLMVLVPEPEAGDHDRLLSGPQGRLLASFFKAAGLDEEDVYLASALPRHTPLADWPKLAQDGLDKVTLHHIALAKPLRILVLGRSVLPLITNDPTQSPTALEEINHLGHRFPSMISRNLDVMLARPATRAVFWRRWLDWTGR